MGIATELAPAPSGGMKPYTLWEIVILLFNDAMVEIGTQLKVRREFESLAVAYMRLAELADRNTLLDPNVPIDED